MAMAILILAGLLMYTSPFHVTCDAPTKLKSEEIVNTINSDTESTWKADTYGSKEIDVEKFATANLGTRLSIKYDKTKEIKFDIPRRGISNSPPRDDDLPKDFNWALPDQTKCPISHIRDQANCGSCWAVSAVAAMQDRFCIKSKGKINEEFSAGYVAACDHQNYGCNGGYMNKVYDFLKDSGTITGGDYDSDLGCQPYPIRPCGSNKMPCAFSGALSPKCRGKKCVNDWYKYKTELESKTFKYKTWIALQGNQSHTTEYVIRKDIYENGPVTAGFLVCSDFTFYKTGIYIPKICNPLGGHAVRIVGWGLEDGIKYWIVANSWTKDWGEDGFFRIIRGINAVYFESEVHGGIPLLKLE